MNSSSEGRAFCPCLTDVLANARSRWQRKIAFCLKRGCFIGPQNQRFRLKKGGLSKIREKEVFFKLGYKRGIRGCWQWNCQSQILYGTRTRLLLCCGWPSSYWCLASKGCSAYHTDMFFAIFVVILGFFVNERMTLLKRVHQMSMTYVQSYVSVNLQGYINRTGAILRVNETSRLHRWHWCNLTSQWPFKVI